MIRRLEDDPASVPKHMHKVKHGTGIENRRNLNMRPTPSAEVLWWPVKEEIGSQPSGSNRENFGSIRVSNLCLAP
jgi:hypothetical protein